VAVHVAAETQRPFICSRCTWGRHCDASRAAPYLKWHITYRGETVFHSRTCPLPLVSATSNQMIRLYRHYKAGRYPFAGGLLDQPNFYIDAMEVIEGVSGEIEEERAKARRSPT
jgi:hypothetical protein